MAPRNKGLDRLKRKLSSMPGAARKELRRALDQSAFEIADTAHANAPREDGNLRRSIRTENGDHDMQVHVLAGGPLTTRPVRKGQSATYDYALGTEFGNKDTPAQPFFFPAYRANKRRVKSRVNRAVKKAAQITAKGP